MSFLPNIASKKTVNLPKWRTNPHSIEKFQFLYTFLPHPDKKIRAGFLSHQALITYSLIMLLVFGLLTFVPKVLPGILGYASDIKALDLFELTNKKRAEYGLSKLSYNKTLSAAAEKKAVDMFTKGYWAHVAPNGKEPWDFILAEKYDYSYAGENLAKNFATSKEVVQAWHDSPSHRDNLLNKNYDDVGFAVVNGVLNGYETTLVVQMFGKSRDNASLASINAPEEAIPSGKPVAVPNVTVGVPTPVLVETKSITVLSGGKVMPTINVADVTKTLNLIFGMFVALLLGLDLWYTRVKAIPKFTGHTVAHLSFLLIVVFGVWFVLAPGKIL